MAKKTLILYYSWSGNTKKLAEKIHTQISDSDLKEVDAVMRINIKPMISL